MSRTIPLLGFALVIVVGGLVAAFALTNDSRTPAVNVAQGLLECGPAQADAGNPLDGEPRTHAPETREEVVAPDVRPEQEFVVAGSVTATAGELPATLSVTARLAGSEPIVVELRRQNDFRIPVSKPGSYELKAEADSWYQLSPVRLQAAPDASAEIKLAPAALLNGRVDGSDGAILAGARLKLLSGGKLAGEAITDAGGRYTLRELRPSSYRIEVAYGDNEGVFSTFLVIGDNTEDLVVNTGARLTLELLDDLGNPVTPGADDVKLNVYRGHTPAPSGARADVSSRPGELVWQGLKDGARYMLNIQVPGFAQKYESLDVAGADVEHTVKLERGASITGEVVLDSEIDVSGVLQVRVTSKNAALPRTSRLDADRHFEVGSLAYGEYTVVLMDITSNKVMASETIELTGGTRNLSFKVDLGSTLVIELVDENGAPAPASLIMHSEKTDYHWMLLDDTGRGTFAFLDAKEFELSIRSRSPDHAPLTVPIKVEPGANTQRIVLRRANCLRLTWVYPDSQAANAGLLAKDLLLSFNGAKSASLAELQQAIEAVQPGDSVELRLIRDGAEMTLTVAWTGDKFGIAATPALHD